MSATCKRLPRGRVFKILLMLPLACFAAVGWAATEQEGEPKAAFDDFDDQKDYPSQDALKRLLTPVPDYHGKIDEHRDHRFRACRISGIFRIGLPWEAGSALRFSLLDPNDLRLHLWNGRQGVTLAYYPRFHHTWAAFATTREGSEPKSEPRALWATDGGRYRRSGLGTLELHCQEGHLILTRGDLRLLSVPFPGPPAEVYVEGSALVRGLAVVPSSGVPAPPQARPVVFRAEKPAELDWTLESSEGAVFNRLPDGGVELSADEKSSAAQAGIRVVKPGLHEFVFLVETPTPGAGIYLGSDEGKQLCRLAFFRHGRPEQVVFGPLHPSHTDLDRRFDQRHQPVPLAGQRQWFRLTVGAGAVKYWTSGDGVHWSQAGPGAEAIEGACTHVGLYCFPVRQKRAVKLVRIEVHRLDTLASLAPEAIQDRVDVGPLIQVGNEETWEQKVAETRPSDVPTDLWWRACALRTLSENPRLPLGQAILDRLQETVLAAPGDLPWKLQVLEEAALLTHPGVHNPAERLAQRYERLGLSLARQGDDAPFTVVCRAMMRLPLWTEPRLAVFSDRLLRHELFWKLGRDRFSEVEELCRVVRYWNRVGPHHSASPAWSDQARHLVYWAETQATGRVPEEAGPQAVGPSPWRHPLQVSPTREGYNIFGEFTAALEGEMYREACQILASAARTEGLGLLPDKDRRLWVSLPVAVELAMREYPPLREAMQEGFGALAELRLNRAVAQGDEASVAAVALQFYGTTAARDAHGWLGDRKLAAGHFAEAIAHYQEAIEMIPGTENGSLRARQRLAAALMGRDFGEPPDTGIEIGGRRLSARQFEQLVEELLRTRRSVSSEAADSPAERAPPCLAPGSYQAKPWATVESPNVRKPGPMPDRELDWAGRQTAVTVTDRQMFVSNQIDQVAFDLESGRQEWVQRGPAVEPQWPLVPMRTVVGRDRVFIRRLVEVTPELACLGRADGQLLWSCKPDSYVASDPIVLGERLFVLTVAEEAADKLILNLAEVDAATGRIRNRAPLAGFFDVWHRRLSLQATVEGDQIVVVGGGSLLCCDSTGEVHWVRRQIWTPPPRNEYRVARPWFEQFVQPPLVADGRVYGMQPGTWCVECVELLSGRLVWRQAVPDLTRLAGLAGRRLVVQAIDGLTALDTDSGKALWFHAADAPQHARLCAADEMVVFVQPRKGEGDAVQFELVWLDVETGLLRERTTLDTPADSAPFLGPLSVAGGRQWASFGSAGIPTKRVLLELLPVAAEPER